MLHPPGPPAPHTAQRPRAGGAGGSVDPVDPTDSPASLARAAAPPASTTHNTKRVNTKQYNTIRIIHYTAQSRSYCATLVGANSTGQRGGGRRRELRGKLLGMGPAAYVTAHGKAKPEHEKRNKPARRGGFHARQSASTQRYPTSAPPPSRPRARAPPDPIHAPPRTRSPPDAPSPRRRHPNSSFQTTKMADDEVAALVVDNGSGMSMSHVQVAGFGNLAHTEGCRPSEPSSCSL